jgi:hypothetical protein
VTAFLFQHVITVRQLFVFAVSSSKRAYGCTIATHWNKHVQFGMDAKLLSRNRGETFRTVDHVCECTICPNGLSRLKFVTPPEFLYQGH